MIKELYNPFIIIKNADLSIIRYELDRYGYMGYNTSEVNEIEYEIYKNSEMEVIVEFTKGLLFPEFIYLNIDFQNQKVNNNKCDVYGFFPTKVEYEITKQFNGKIVMLFWNNEVKEEDLLNKIKLATMSNKNYEIETIDFIANQVETEKQFLIEYLKPQHKNQIIEIGKIFIEKEDYIQDYLNDLK